MGSCEAEEAGRPQEEQKAASSAMEEEQCEHFGMRWVVARQDCTSGEGHAAGIHPERLCGKV